jgi:uncharacterized protein GlcG (DUF336 family)
LAFSRTAALCGLLLLTPALRAQEALLPINNLSPSAALELAKTALDKCRASGFQVAVAVVDRMGVPQVMLRDRYAGPHTPDTAEQLAWTAVSFRTDTKTLAENTRPDSDQAGSRMIPGVLMIGGGVPVQAGGTLVGGIGVSGTPSGVENDRCARAGLAAMKEKLELAD